jgi:hypothetical protein
MCALIILQKIHDRKFHSLVFKLKSLLLALCKKNANVIFCVNRVTFLSALSVADSALTSRNFHDVMQTAMFTDEL